MTPLYLIASIVAATGIGLHFVQPPGAFWLDETWTGMTAAQPSLGDVMREIYDDCNAPLYCLLMHFWSLVAGISNEALRLPSIILSALAPLLAFLLDKKTGAWTALIWCALAAIWVPGIVYSEEARCYAFLFALSMAGTALYANLLMQPSLRRASAWALISCVMILTHYHAGFLILCQGLGYLSLHRGKAVRTAACLLIFLPAVAWIAYHAPRLAQFAATDVAWYRPLGLPELLFASSFVGFNILATLLILMIATRKRETASRAEDDGSFMLWIAVAASVAGAALVIGIGFLQPSFTTRYMMPFAPGVLLGTALALRDIGRRWAIVPAILLPLLLVATPIGLWRGTFQIFKRLNWETASLSLMKSAPDHLVFLWESSPAKFEKLKTLEGVGGFFFLREHRPVDVTPIVMQPNADPNPVVLAAAQRPGTVIIWIYDLTWALTPEHKYPPRIEALDPSWHCDNFGRNTLNILACARKTETPADL